MSAKIIKTGGGTFEPNEQNIYFIATHAIQINWLQEYHSHFLIAVNELNDNNYPLLEQWLADGRNIFLDSGVYNLAMEHANKHGLSHDEGLATPIHEIDGFDDLLNKYIEIVSRHKDRLWGYIEIDLGGREQKIKTRAMLEQLGLRPIPVYHPFSDGWDYFDYLAERYDRICFGNIVQADGYTRKRLLATMWERHKKYPHLWVHLLGMTPNQHLNAYPSNSADSSTWSNVVRWSGYIPRVQLQSIGHMSKEYQYILGTASHDISYQQGIRMGATGSYFNQLNWRNHLESLRKLGFPVYE